MIIRPHNCNVKFSWWGEFRYKDEQLINMKTGNAVDATSNSGEGTQVVVAGRNNSIQQKWKIQYVDQTTKEPTEGFNEQFGFHVNRPFYMRSRLPLKRVAECHGANNVWLKKWRNNVKAQQWYFDGVSKTIRNNHWKSHSLDIFGNGTSNNLRCTSTNSRWW
jgi:hypothetical protein